MGKPSTVQPTGWMWGALLLSGAAAWAQPVPRAHEAEPTLSAPTPPAPAAPAVAVDTGSAWWWRADQRARTALDGGDPASARSLAADPALSAAAAYREGDYAAAATTWAELDQPDAHYNRGNALARAGDLQAALAAYDQTLRAEPDHADAQANRAIVEEALRQQQQQQQQDGQQQDGQQQDGQQQDGQQQDGQQQDGQQQDGQQQDGQQQDGQQQDGQQQDGQQQDGQQQDGQQQDGQQQDGQQQDGQQQDGQQQNPSSSAAQEPTDAEQQAQAEAAQKAAMEQALQQQDAAAATESEPSTEEAKAQTQTPLRPLTEAERAQLESQQALQQWLRRVPDDPGALLRRKFAREHQLRQRGEDPR